MEIINIRPAKADDLAQLQKISKQTFLEAFAGQNSQADIELYFERSFSTEKLASEISNKDSVFYFAEYQAKIIGYLKLNFGQAQTDLKDESAVEIERIYVLKEFYGKDAGQLLYQQALKHAASVKARYIWLGVWEKNPRAIRFYEKNGFVAFDKHAFMLGSDKQTDILMKLQLKTD